MTGMTEGSAPIERWRPPWTARLVAWAAAAGFLGMAGWTLTFGWPECLLSLAYLLVAVVFWSLVSCSLGLYPDRVVVDGALRRQREVLLSDVRAVEVTLAPYASGLFLRTAPYEGVHVPDAIGHATLASRLFHYRSRGDRIADAIRARAAAAGRSGVEAEAKAVEEAEPGAAAAGAIGAGEGATGELDADPGDRLWREGQG